VLDEVIQSGILFRQDARNGTAIPDAASPFEQNGIAGRADISRSRAHASSFLLSRDLEHAVDADQAINSRAKGFCGECFIRGKATGLGSRPSHKAGRDKARIRRWASRGGGDSDRVMACYLRNASLDRLQRGQCMYAGSVRFPRDHGPFMHVEIPMARSVNGRVITGTEQASACSCKRHSGLESVVARGEKFNLFGAMNSRSPMRPVSCSYVKGGSMREGPIGTHLAICGNAVTGITRRSLRPPTSGRPTGKKPRANRRHTA